MRSIIIVPVCALGVGLLAGAADAGEPQALLVATQGEIALRCEAGECAADVTTICLQRDRDTPLPGTPYEAIELAGAHGALTLVGRTADGREVALTGRVPVALSAARRNADVRKVARYSANGSCVVGPLLNVPQRLMIEHRELEGIPDALA